MRRDPPPVPEEPPAPAGRAFCRDCVQFVPDAPDCPRCHGPRLLRHPELDSLAVAHVDCDAFYAAVEKRDRPHLRRRPLVVAGRSRRAVVTTACYLARMHGVRSAMPLYRARELCPDAVVVPPDFPRYRAASREIRALMAETGGVVEPASIDEAWIDLRDADGGPPAKTLADFALRVESEVGVSVSIGLSYCKMLAKMASDIEKPQGFSVIGRADARGFLAPLPVERLHGVGPSLRDRLRDHGITTVGQLQGLDPEWLVRRFGRMGRLLHDHSLGEDRRPVQPPERAKSVSVETTLPSDIADLDAILARVAALAPELAERLRTSGLKGRTVVLKLKRSDFQILTRQTRLAEPTGDADAIRGAAARLAEPLADGTAYRLVGIGMSSLEGEDDEAPAAAAPLPGVGDPAEAAPLLIRDLPQG